MTCQSSFCFRKLFSRGVLRAMDEHIAVEDLPDDGQRVSSDPYGAPLNEIFRDDPDEAIDDESHELKGFRKRWLKRNRSPDEDECLRS